MITLGKLTQGNQRFRHKMPCLRVFNANSMKAYNLKPDSCVEEATGCVFCHGRAESEPCPCLLILDINLIPWPFRKTLLSSMCLSASRRREVVYVQVLRLTTYIRRLFSYINLLDSLPSLIQPSQTYICSPFCGVNSCLQLHHRSVTTQLMSTMSTNQANQTHPQPHFAQTYLG